MIVDNFYAGLQIAREMDHVHLQKKTHIEKLSSGKRILSGKDDAGGLSQAMKHRGAAMRAEKVSVYLQNTLSYTQVQDGALTTVGKIYSRMAQLATLAMDVSKSDLDRDNYEKEFQELREQTLEISTEEFNGQALFRNKSYAVVQTGSITWDTARTNVKNYSDSDSENTHYLATITSQDEQDEIKRQVGSLTGIELWIGGSDQHTEGDWRWVEGPEGEEDGGLGRLFWRNGVDSKGEKGETGVKDSFLNWNRGEPNNAGNEDALQIRITGDWNDYRTSNTRPRGYLRETDQNNLKVLNHRDGDGFELQKITYKRFLPSTTIGLDTVEDAQSALGRLREAIDDVASKRAQAGANMSRLKGDIGKLRNESVSYGLALSRVEDLDYSRETRLLATKTLKLQANAAILTQANLLTKENLLELIN